MLADFFSDFLAEGKRIFTEDILGVIPDAIGYVAMFSGALMIVSPLIGRNIVQSFGIFAFFSLLGIAVMGAF